MAKNQNYQVEIYIQRYETWRYLDKIRWQFFQLLIAVSSLSVLFYGQLSVLNKAIFIPIFGLVLISWCLFVFKVSNAIRLNGQQLKKFGSLIGDEQLPDVSNTDNSIVHWVTVFVLVLAVVLVVFGLIFFPNIEGK